MKNENYDNNIHPNLVEPDIEGNASEVIDEKIREFIEKDTEDDIEIFDTHVLPKDLEKIGETPIMNETNVFKDILEEHKTPKNKLGYLKVLEGQLDFVWADAPELIYTVDANHPLVIFPEKSHRVILTGPVQFKVEFYKIDDNTSII